MKKNEENELRYMLLDAAHQLRLASSTIGVAIEIIKGHQNHYIIQHFETVLEILESKIVDIDKKL